MAGRTVSTGGRVCSEQEGVLPSVIASYEAVALLAEYSPCVNPHQVKNALLFREESERVEKIIAEHRLFPDRLFAAVGRVASCRGAERNRIAARLLRDLMCYHRDLRGLEAVSAGFDSINLVTGDKVRELSTLNGMLYEFLPPEDQRPSEDRVLHHVIVKADVRDSSRLTRSLMEKGMNAASYFSLNFYEPVNKLLAKYGATKVFLEGDAIILALLEREGEAMLSVSRACVLAAEILSLLRGYNELLERAGLPEMEVGLGLAYQDSAPLYLMDGEHHIMISEAINDSDRLSSCNKRVRKKLAPDAGIFQVYSVQIGSNESPESGVEELRLNYNVGGICLSEAAFRKMDQEIALVPWNADFTGPWMDDAGRILLGNCPARQRHVSPDRYPQEPHRAGRRARSLHPALDRPLLLRSVRQPRRRSSVAGREIRRGDKPRLTLPNIDGETGSYERSSCGAGILPAVARPSCPRMFIAEIVSVHEQGFVHRPGLGP